MSSPSDLDNLPLSKRLTHAIRERRGSITAPPIGATLGSMIGCVAGELFLGKGGAMPGSAVGAFGFLDVKLVIATTDKISFRRALGAYLGQSIEDEIAPWSSAKHMQVSEEKQDEAIEILRKEMQELRDEMQEMSKRPKQQ